MKCIYCNSPLAAIDFCPGCGADVTILKRTVRISNLLYNRGLEKASVRDLSGAISVLKQSLKFDKENTNARNLLGLCYFETGEVVSALCEWVVSKNIQPEDNLADYYINKLQNNKNRLDTINQTIRKYNQSIEYCRQGNEDMAMIQLKKVIAQNPKLVKAYQLQALLYMKHQDYEKARRLLKKASNVDNTNTTTLRYLTEIEEITGKSSFSSRRRREAEDSEQGTLRYVSGNETIIQPTTFRDSSSVATFINIALGILLGGAIVWFLMVPASRQSILDAANEKVTDANLQLASETARLQDLQEQIDGYSERAATAERERDASAEKTKKYDELLGIADQFMKGDQVAAVESIEKLNGDDYEGNALALYKDLVASVSSTLFSQYYTEGTTAYVSGDYAKAAKLLQQAVESDPEGTNPYAYDALYYLGFAYYNQGDTVNADQIFKKIVEKYPAQASQVQPYINNTSATPQQSGIGQGESTVPAGSTTGGTTGSTDTQGTLSPEPAPGSEQNIYNEYQDGDITIYDDSSYYNDDSYYDPSQIAWTDPTTGLNYDAYGNLIG